MELRRRHYQNRVGPDKVGFFTSTVLDFAHALRRPEVKEAMIGSLLADLHAKGARLHGFVVMSNHLHFVACTPPAMDGSHLMQVIKRNSAKRILSLLHEEEAVALSQQQGLNRRSFWKASFRSLVLRSGDTIQQKLDYMHANPVRAGLCEHPEDYRWSSARLWLQERFVGDDYVLNLPEVLAEFHVGVASAESRDHGRYA